MFSDWLRNFDRDMRRKTRNVLLFFDNAPSHKHEKFDNLVIKTTCYNKTTWSSPLGGLNRQVLL